MGELVKTRRSEIGRPPSIKCLDLPPHLEEHPTVNTNMEKSELHPVQENVNEISIEQIESRESKDLESNQEKVSTSELTPHVSAVHPPMTFKRGMALTSLTLLFVTSVAPNFFISSSLCITSIPLTYFDSLYRQRHRG